MDHHHQQQQTRITAEQIQEMLEARGCTITTHISFHEDHMQGYIAATDPKDGLSFEISYSYDTVERIENIINALFGEKEEGNVSSR